MSKLKFHAKNNITIIFAGSGELEFEEFCILAARFLIEEDEEQMRKELKEAFRFYDKEGRCTCPCQSRIYFSHINNSDNLKSPLDGVPIATKVKIPILKSMKNLVKLKIFTIFYSRGLPDGRNSFKHFTRIGTRSERRAIERNH